MSIYSGFATRAQQQQYDRLTQDLIFILQKRIIQFYKEEESNDLKFIDFLNSPCKPINISFQKYPALFNYNQDIEKKTIHLKDINQKSKTKSTIKRQPFPIKKYQQADSSTIMLKPKTALLIGRIKHQIQNEKEQSNHGSKSKIPSKRSEQSSINYQYGEQIGKLQGIKARTYPKKVSIIDGKDLPGLLREQVGKGTKGNHKRDYIKERLKPNSRQQKSLVDNNYLF